MSNHFFKWTLLTSFAFILAAIPLSAKTYLYPAGASNPWGTRGDGTVAQANTDLSITLNAIPTNEVVWMAAGNYSINASIALAANVTIYGGFLGNESTTSARPLLDADNGVLEPWEFQYQTTIKGAGFSSTAITYPVFNLGTVAGITLNGITIDGFNITNKSGGAIYTKARPNITNCIIRNINQVSGTSNYGGAGIFSEGAGGATITGCLFETCATEQAGGAINAQTKITITQCVIRNNYGGIKAGAVYLQGTADAGNTTNIINNAIYNNAGGQSGAMQIYSSSSDANIGPLNMINNTFANNVGGTTYSGALYGFRSSSISSFKYYNNIFYNNKQTTTSLVNNMNFSTSTGTVDLQYSAYNGGATTAAGSTISTIGNQSSLSAPNFVSSSTSFGYNATMPADVKAANFSILGTSPLINTGGTFSGLTPSTDLLNNSRPNGAANDMGAYEYSNPILVSTLNLAGLTSGVEKSFTVSGTNLTGNIIITPPTDYQISTTSGSGYQSTPVTLITSGGSVVSTPIYVLVNGSPSTVENITITSTGVAAQNIYCYNQNLSQTITFSATATKTYGDGYYTPTATASSGLPVTYASTNTSVATIVSNQIHIVGAGSSTITASQAGDANNTAAANVTQTLTVNPKTLTAITGTVAGVNKVYDGTTNATISGTFTGIIGSDVVTLSGTFANANIGTAIAITANSTLSGASASNYTYTGTLPTGKTANITAAPLTITGITGAAKVYDGTLTASLSGTATYSGLVNGELFTVTGTPVAVFATATIGTNKALTISGYTVPSANYSVTQPTSIKANITTAPLTITGISGINKVYDGTNATTLSGTPVYSGLVNAETFAVTGTPVATFADEAVANGKTVTVTGYTAPTANYSVTQPTLTANIYPVVSTWNGSGSWSTGGSNWTYSPLAATDVVICSGELIIDQTPTVHSVTVNPGAKLTLGNGKTINAGTVTIQSDATGTGTFVDNNSVNPAITANVQQYLTIGRNWYISSPVSGATGNAVLGTTGNSLWQYNEVNSDWTTDVVTSSTPMTIMKGFVANTIGGALTFSGPLNSGNLSILLNRTENGNAERGYNLAGNPYPSYLDWNKVYNASANIDPTMWYRTMKGLVYEFDTYNAASGVGTDNGTAVCQYIPPMQAFWVLVSEGNTTGTLAVNNTMRSHDATGTNLLKTKSTIQPAQRVLRLQVSNGTNSDEAIVLFNQNAENGYDIYDSPKMTNANKAIPEIYTMAGSKQVVINGLNNISPAEELALGFTTGESNEFTIKASEVSNFDAGTRIILKDNLLNTEQDLTAVPSYSFTSDVISTTGRFSLLFKSPSVATGLPNENQNPDILIYKNAENQIVIHCSSAIDNKNSYMVFNAIGQKLITGQLSGTMTEINNNLRPGVYLVKVTNAGKSNTQRIILH